MRPINSPELNTPNYYVRENIRGQSRVPSETENIAELKGNAANESISVLRIQQSINND